MLPHQYELPVAIVLVLAGALACFAGYRLFRVVLAIYGFVLGAMIASSVMGVTNTTKDRDPTKPWGYWGAVLPMTGKPAWRTPLVDLPSWSGAMVTAGGETFNSPASRAAMTCSPSLSDSRMALR